MGREPFLAGSRVDCLCTQLYYVWFDRVLDGGRWYNGLLQWIAVQRRLKTTALCKFVASKKHLI